jgi:YidC/Oxa1 family membrane protein insertase
MYDLIASLLAFFYKLIPDYGVAIALLTVAVMLLLTPLTLKGTRSMMMMQNIQPEMKKLQSQYKDDRQKLNEEVLKLYRENNINPLSGCLPLLIQIPVFFVLVGLLRGLTRTADLVINEVHVHGFDPRYLDKGSKLFQSLYGKTEMKSWGMNLADSSIIAMQHSIGKAIPYFILIVGVLITSVIQQRQISGRNPAQRENPQAQLMMKLGPTMITGFSIFAPGGLVIYFFVSNLFRVGQQALISHTIYKSPEAKALLERQHAEAAEKAKKTANEPKKGFFEKLVGDAAPKVREPRGNAKQSGRNGKATPNGKGTDGKANTNGSSDKQQAKPPLAKSGGRATPPGSRSSASRKKKKRK